MLSLCYCYVVVMSLLCYGSVRSCYWHVISRLCYCIPIRLVYVIVSCGERKDAACTLAIDMEHDHFGRAGPFHSNFIGIFLDLELPLPVKTPSWISSDS